MQDPYEALGLERTATADDIKAAYRAGCKKWHPDRARVDDREEANRRMQEINDAYAILSDPARRARFDASGDTSPRGRLVENARAILANEFSKVVDHELSTDPITTLIGILEGMKRQGFADRQATSQRKRFLERKQKALRGPKEDNFLAPVLQGKIDQLTRTLAQLDEAIEVFGIAGEILKTYSWELAADPEAGFAQMAGLLGQTWPYGSQGAGG